MFNALPQHPGASVREAVLVAKKLTVTEAAKLLDVGRPALSNFLNGNAAASPDMAARVERVFGIPAQKLLDMQAAYNAAVAKSSGAASSVTVYVPRSSTSRPMKLKPGHRPLPPVRASQSFSGRWSTPLASDSPKWIFPATMMRSAPVGTAASLLRKALRGCRRVIPDGSLELTAIRKRRPTATTRQELRMLKKR